MASEKRVGFFIEKASFVESAPSACSSPALCASTVPNDRRADFARAAVGTLAVSAYGPWSDNRAAMDVLSGAHRIPPSRDHLRQRRACCPMRSHRAAAEPGWVLQRASTAVPVLSF